ncbi:hypothetical protein M9H77_28552 [Catharanthus roseus]|uniref:Uncharacterized protein n=1 Tax=Catharanthus roseus TaxID=4058 RepID=A0ACC0AHW8_CATRO|nr:hypothetical protein M9H77_28552 [Catharanthus roseus]
MKRSDSGKFTDEQGLSHDEIVNIIKSPNGFRLVDAQDIRKERWVLTQEGAQYAEAGSPEIQLFLAIPNEGITQEDLQKKLDPSLFKIAWQQAIKNKWIEVVKSRDSGSSRMLGSHRVENVEDRIKDLLVKIQNGEDVGSEDIDALKRRKLIAQQTWKGYSVRKGPKELEFKEYNFSAKGQPVEGGHLHPLLKVRRQVQMVFSPDGMPTNNFVESSFWNFDALFQPQQHPARDSHDTFFLKEPSTTSTLPEDYVQRVKQIHESGGYGSRGYGYEWKREEANKNLLRTHTTAVSSRMLYALAQQPFAPKKYYSIDRVFRNEAVDRTHLGTMIKTWNTFCFLYPGMSKLRYKPAYNPYTEPSMEIFSYHGGLQKWVEVGNSGMFRPEMLRPMGLAEDVHVIAWVLSLKSPTMILYGIDNIRNLFGHKVDLDLIKANPICRLGL